MAKFNVSVELEWIDEEYNLDDEIKNEIVSRVVNAVQDKLIKQVENECTNTINSQIKNIDNAVSEKLNCIMDTFFDEPRDVTDGYGYVIEKGVTVKDRLKKACDEFMDQSLDQYGKPCTGYGTKYKTRVDYIVEKSINYDMEYAIKNAVSDVTNNLKKKITDEVKKQMSDKLAGVLELDKMFT